MGVVNVVEYLCGVLEEQIDIGSSNNKFGLIKRLGGSGLSSDFYRKLLNYVLHIGNIRYWAEKRHLETWESDACSAIPHPLWSEEKEYHLLVLAHEVFEFGQYNLYGAFDEEGTIEEYDKLFEKFAEHDIELVPSRLLGFDGWL